MSVTGSQTNPRGRTRSKNGLSPLSDAQQAGGQSNADTYDDTFQRMLDMNLNSVFHILRATIPVLRQTGNGRIIAIGSRQALEPSAGVGANSASKAAMVSLIKMSRWKTKMRDSRPT